MNLFATYFLNQVNIHRVIFISLFTLLGPYQAATAQTQPLLNLRDIANQTQEDITTILGPQSSLNDKDAASSICANCQKYSYQNDHIIIEYTNDMADRITIRPQAGIRAEATPALLGLPNLKADVVRKSLSKWTGYDGVREISAFKKSDGTIDFVLVKVLTL